MNVIFCKLGWHSESHIMSYDDNPIRKHAWEMELMPHENQIIKQALSRETMEEETELWWEVTKPRDGQMKLAGKQW